MQQRNFEQIPRAKVNINSFVPNHLVYQMPFGMYLHNGSLCLNRSYLVKKKTKDWTNYTYKKRRYFLAFSSVLFLLNPRCVQFSVLTAAVPLDPSKKFKEKNQQQPSDVIELQMKRKHQRRGLEAKSVKHLPSLLPQR